MRVVFLDDVEGVARAGEIKNVADGYARNFLLPRKLAAAASTSTVQQAESRARALAKEQEKLDEAARAVAEQLAGFNLTLAARAGPEGRLFGSVTASDIADAVRQHVGGTLEHRQVQLDAPIKEVGSYEIAINLTRNVKANVSLLVHAEGQDPSTALAAPAAAAKEEDEEDEDENEEEDDEDEDEEDEQ
jgi:large subunit ribosomal protein L9